MSWVGLRWRRRFDLLLDRQRLESSEEGLTTGRWWPASVVGEGPVAVVELPVAPTGHREIRVLVRPFWACTGDGVLLARLNWQECAGCQVGTIVKIGVDHDVDRRGLASTVIRHVVEDHPGWVWSTTPRTPDGAALFAALGERGLAFVGDDGPLCSHQGHDRHKEPVVIDEVLTERVALLKLPGLQPPPLHQD